MECRTDLAIEQREAIDAEKIDGVESEEYSRAEGKVTKIRVTSQAGSQAIGKPIGTYVTIEMPRFSDSADASDDAIDAVAEELQQLLPPEGLVLVTGLGNDSITPDALGPKAAGEVLATRHITGEIARAAGLEGLRPVAVLSPGVLGQTGIETVEILLGLCQKLQPAAVVMIDAMASRRLSRLGCTVQLCDSGISPGAGVHNARPLISKETLGVPVISIGVPTVVEARTMLIDMSESLQRTVEERQIDEQAAPGGMTMIVTPREIDLLIDRAARFVAMAINGALQPQFSPRDLLTLVS